MTLNRIDVAINSLPSLLPTRAISPRTRDRAERSVTYFVFLLTSLFLTLMTSADFAEDLAPPTGVRLFVCGHSFHAYVGRIMPEIATAAGITGQNVEVQFVGGSSVSQCWDYPDPNNAAK